MALWIPGEVRGGGDPPGKLWHEGRALSPLHVMWGGERPELAPQSPCAGLAGGGPGVSLCLCPHCGCSATSTVWPVGEVVCVLGPAGAPWLQILGGSCGSIQRGPAGGQCCWEGLWATSCPRGGSGPWPEWEQRPQLSLSLAAAGAGAGAGMGCQAPG